MKDIIHRQRHFFGTNATRPVAFRLEQLRRLASALTSREGELDEAILADVGKSRVETLLTELYLVHDEIRAAVDSLEAWAAPRPIPPGPLSDGARAFVVAEPLGVSLIIGPWNYPFQLTLAPLVAAMAAGCTAVVKPSELMPHSSAALARVLLNSGQTCIAPDYVYVHESVEQALLDRIVAEIRHGDYGVEKGNFVQIVNERNLARLVALIDPTKVYEGGRHDSARRTLAPTVLRGVTWDDRVMQEEIFGPILPVLTYRELGDVVAQIKARPRPLSLYLFTRDASVRDRIVSEISFGGGCINDTILHIATRQSPFGGVGDSGIGQYHGKDGFDAFSHPKTILEQPLDGPDDRYPPYGARQLATMEALVESVRV